jgi:hypothetical protein
VAYLAFSHSQKRATASGSGEGAWPGSFISIQVSRAELAAYRETTFCTYSSASTRRASVSTMREPCERYT